MTFSNLLLVGLGGFLGSIARYVSSVSIDQKLNSIFPYGTFTVNLMGSFLLGLLYGWTSHNASDVSNTRLFLITGFCGGFTTFSAFAFENFDLLSTRMTASSVIYSLTTVLLGIILVWAGIWIAKSI
jgi:fluoride exporter